ncbi:hypothetical protein FNV43_RR01540 [Rhamnella rubrinervis]|uniref:Sieve element occlusion C-terminal domain-containing protein n=1 Tax=Rhamnella rubrinervis TaxID=2594499 RepID=A0A8K0HPT4_9ROSA|nr:hypothetical protein FNV43_RR01540 [Rhamnella rubrinervis]
MNLCFRLWFRICALEHTHIYENVFTIINGLSEFRLKGYEASSIWDKDFHPPPHRESWIETLFKDFDPNISTSIKEEKYLFFYGGKDDDWIQRFTSKAQALLDSPTLKEARVDIKLFCVGKSGKGGEDLSTEKRFWTKAESMFFSNISYHHYKQMNLETLEVQRLLSYKNEAGWALLSKGSTVVTNGHGSIVLKVVEEFEKWKDRVVNNKSFATAFKDCYNMLNSSTTYCCRVDFPSEKENIPITMTCTECRRAMETLISYKCCHIYGPLKEHH